MKERLDVILVQLGLAESREKAKRDIMAGTVRVDGRLEDKAGQKFDMDHNFEIKGKSCPYVSRGGLKLEKALNEFAIDISGKVCMDMGASTGGFTDCMLQNGAVKVYAIDVGYGQLDYKLRTDSRVVNIEKMNIRYLDVKDIPDNPFLITIDVSFISLKHILPIAAELLEDTGTIIALVKPQFEAKREQVGKNGIIRSKEVHIEVINKVTEYAAASGLLLTALNYSPVKGTKGNIEYLACFNNDHALNTSKQLEKIDKKQAISSIVEAAHSDLNNKTGVNASS